jgi:hypothetical protein
MMYLTDVANLALGRLGVGSTINDLANEYSTAAKILKRHLRVSLNSVLEQHTWNFATRSAVLNKQFDDPENGYAFSYYSPADCLAVRQIASDGNFIRNLELYPEQKLPFEERHIGMQILLYTNVRNAHILYTAAMDENSVFPTHFAKSWSAQWAVDIAPSLITNNYPKVRDTLDSDAYNDLAKGIADDLIRTPQYTYAKSPLITTRY